MTTALVIGLLLLAAGFHLATAMKRRRHVAELAERRQVLVRRRRPAVFNNDSSGPHLQGVA